jgi:hypothetical protein
MRNEADFEKAGERSKMPVPGTDIPIISGLVYHLVGANSIQYGV